MLVPLLEEKLWLRTNSKGEREIFENSRWVVVPKGEYGRLPKTEAQVWIAIYNLFMDPECRKKYELNDERKNTLLRLRKYMNEVLLDQIPNLSFMLRSLQELSMMNLPTHLSSNPFVVQQLPLVAGAISQGKDWQIIANQHAQRLQSSLNQAEKQYTTRLADLYSNNNVQGLIDGFKCAQCGKEAFKRCSKCKNSWYCSKDCQVKHWPAHKAGCNQRAKQMKQAVQTQPDKTSDNKVSTKVIINTAENPSPKVKTASIDELD